MSVESGLRRWQAATVVAGLLLLAGFATASVLEMSRPWRHIQADFLAAGLGAQLDLPALRAIRACDGNLDRCTTCHLGASESAPGNSLPAVLRPHPTLLDAHPLDEVGCAACHGGNPSALGVEAAHAIPGTRAADPLMTLPHIEASCIRCHVPGQVAGTERVAHGAQAFLQLGCAVCHPFKAAGRGGWDFGPDLRTLGRRDVGQLTEAIVEPQANFPGSTMPAFTALRDHEPELFADLLLFVQALTLEPLNRCRDSDAGGQLAFERCTICHAGPDGRAAGRTEHRCEWIQARREELTCAGCHVGAVPAVDSGGGWCLVIRQHRSACGACHSEEVPWR